MQALDEWNQTFGGEDFTQPSKSTGPGFQWSFQKNHKVRVKRSRLTTSTRGARQLELELSILGQDGEEAGVRKEWLTLPKQPVLDKGQPPDNVRKWTLRRRDDLGKVLAGADAHRFALYSRRHKDQEGKWIYMDNAGEIMSKDALDERSKVINKNIMEASDLMHQDIETGEQRDLEAIQDAEFYVVKVENPKNERYPYTNFHRSPDDRLAMWYEGE